MTQQVKSIPPNQKSLDAIPPGSGIWRVKGEKGLYVRCRFTNKIFLLQRRIGGKLVSETLGPLTMKAAREKASAMWGAVQPTKEATGVTLKTAVEAYIEAKIQAKKMSAKTAELARYNRSRYLADWSERALEDIGRDRIGLRTLQQRITKNHGHATSNQCVRLLSAVYRWHAEVDETLPPWPRKAAEIHTITPRAWAYSDNELQAWWYSREEKDGTVIELGVKTLGPVKRMWWLTALFTGARKGSVEALRWRDVDFERKRIFFFVTKGDRPYAVPMCDKLAELLRTYRDSGDVFPSDWVFPSNRRDNQHIIGVKNDAEGAGPAHRLRHTFRTSLAELGASPDQARLLMGHSMGGDVSRGYITAPLIIESLRPIVNAVAERYVKIAGLD
jgi:integrase